MSPVRTATREHSGERRGRVRGHPPADALFIPETDALREIVVDWQMPSDADRTTSGR